MKKIKEVGFAEESEIYYVVGDVTEKQALKAIHKYEKEECGLSKEELYSYDLEPAEFYEILDGENEGWLWWGKLEKGVNYKFLDKGWTGSI